MARLTPSRRSVCTVFTVVLVLLASPDPLVGQVDVSHRPSELPSSVNGWSLPIYNALVSGLAAGIAQEVQGGDFAAAFLDGALGGLVHYGGKRVAARPFDGSRLLGRQIAAVGTSMTANAAWDRGRFEHLFFPVGPMALEVSSTAAGRRVHASVSMHDLVRMAYRLADDDSELNWGESLRSGAVVFDTCCALDGLNALAAAELGSVVVVQESQPELRDRLLAHEITHVIHTDFFNRLWFGPMEKALARAAVGDRAWMPNVRLEVLYPLTRGLISFSGIVETNIPPLEHEAEYMEWTHYRSTRSRW